MQELLAEAGAAMEEAQALTQAMADRIAAAKAAIEDAGLPVQNLGLEHGRVTLDGLPFSQASDADQLRASIAIAMRGHADLRVIRVRDASLLDEDSMALLETMAIDADYQVWMERVDSSGEVGIVLEDGHVKGQEVAARP